MYKLILIIGSTLAITTAPAATPITPAKGKDVSNKQVDPWVYDFTKRNVEWAPLSGRPKEAPQKPKPWGWKPEPVEEVPVAPKKDAAVVAPVVAAAPVEGAAAAPAAPAADAAAAPAAAPAAVALSVKK